MPAVIEASDQSPLFSPDVAQISQLHVSPGDSVKQGDVLISLESMTLTSQIVEAQRRIDLVTVHGTLLAQGQAESLALFASGAEQCKSYSGKWLFSTVSIALF